MSIQGKRFKLHRKRINKFGSVYKGKGNAFDHMWSVLKKMEANFKTGKRL